VLIKDGIGNITMKGGCHVVCDGGVLSNIFQRWQAIKTDGHRVFYNDMARIDGGDIAWRTFCLKRGAVDVAAWQWRGIDNSNTKASIGP